MPYEEQIWIDFNSKYTLSAARMSHLERGLSAEETRARTAETGLSANFAEDRVNAKVADEQLEAEVGTERARAEAAERGFSAETTSERTRAEAAEKAAREQAEAHSVPITQKGAANGVASLDGTGKVPSSQLPPGEIVSTKTVKKEAELLALKPTKTEIVIVEEPEEKAYVWNGGKTGTITDWTALTFTTGIQEINGKKGATVVLTAANVGADASGAATSAETAAIAAATTKVNTEKSRAEGAETTIAGTVTTETSRAKAAEATISTSVTTERTRAEGSEATIAQSVITESNRAKGIEAGLEAALSSEVGRAKGVETSLEASISATNTALASKVSNTDSRLSDERIPLNNTVTSVKIVNGAVLKEKLSTAVQTELNSFALTVEKTKEVTATTSETPLFDVTEATVQVIALKNNTTLKTPPAVAGKSILVCLKQDSTGARIVKFEGVRWAEGVKPTFSTIANAVDYVSLVCTDGVHWDGFLLGLAFA